MKKSTYNFNGRQRIFLTLLCVSLLTGISFFINYKTEAGNNHLQPQKNNYSLKSFSAARRESSPPVNIGERTSVWLKLEEGKSPDTTFYGSDSAISALQSDLAEPTSQVSTDINADGYADLVSGFRNADGGGLIALHRASRQAFEPTDEQVLADLRRGVFPATFEKDALILDVPTAPDFIVAGKFSEGSAVDLVFASRGGRSIFIMSSDGRGGFGAAREIALEGEITALVSEKIDFKGVYAGIAVSVSTGKTSNLVIFNGKDELLKTAPHRIPVEGTVDSIILAKKDFIVPTVDLFGLADGRIFTVSDIADSRGGVNPIDLPFQVKDFAVGEFIRDRQGKAEIAVLSENGSVAYLKNGSLDTRPFTTAEMQEARRAFLDNKNTLRRETNNSPDNWTEAESHNLNIFAAVDNPAKILRKAYITGNETEDLMVVDSQAKRVQILFKEPNTDENRTSFTDETKFQNVDFAETPVSVLPMRLNVMGQQGFVFFSKGSLEPTPVILAPNATFNVTTTTDENNGCGAGAGCSVREAIIDANNMAGADMVTFTPNGTHQLMIDLAGVDNTSAEGDLDVLQALTVVGNGAANTIIQAGTNTTNGIDKVLSVNPLFTMSFASSFSNMTLRFGRNPSPAAGDGFGGAMDWEGTSTGTITLSGMTINSSTALNGPGGGAALVNSGGGVGAATLTNVTVSSNSTSVLFGGGIAVGNNTGISATSLVVSGNSVTNPVGSIGGGILLGTNSNGNGTASFTSLTLMTNSVVGNGGGIFTSRGLTMTAPTIISNNSATGGGTNGFGGGISMNTAASVNISKATMVGNSATSNGGAIEIGSGSGGAGNVLNMSFSRIVGNTGGGFTGLVTRGGTANVENNWWGCNTGPSAAPCDTAGAITGGVLDFNPWLRYTHTASPSSIVVGQSTTLTASFLTNSDNVAVGLGNLTVLIGLPIAFNTPVRGTISGAQATIQASGTATAIFTATMAGAGSANAAVDNGTATASIAIGMATTTTTITSDNPEPSVVGQTITVNYTVVGQFGGTPTGTVTVSDGVNSCMGTVAAGTCNVALMTAGARTLTATYAGDANFTGSMDTEPHQVNKANTTSTITAESADPTAQGEVFTVFYTVTVNSPGAGTPTGNVTVSDGINSCVGTVAAGQCSLFLNTVGVRTLTATYGSDANFNGSVSAGVPHTVLPIVAASVSISGRVQTQTGRGISNARIILTDQNGEVVTAISNGFGYYYFQGIQAGETYFFTVRHKEYQFAPQAVTINEDIADLNFTALE